MRTPNEEFDDFMIDESDEYLLKMAEELKHELSDIKVSDELIAKTLAKVSSQEQANTKQAASNVIPMESIKAPVKYKRRNYGWIKPLSVAAAACFVLLLGVNVMRNGMIESKKEMSSDSSYEMQATGDAQNSGIAMEESTNLKSAAATDAPQVASEEDSTMEAAGVEQYTMQSPDYQDKETTVIENGVYRLALNEATNDATNAANSAAQVYGFLDSTNNDQALQLLTLLTSDELMVSTSDPADEWEYYLVFSLGDEDAVTYQVGKNQYVIATNYHGLDSKSQVIYEIKDIETFKASLIENLK